MRQVYQVGIILRKLKKFDDCRLLPDMVVYGQEQPCYRVADLYST